MVASFLKACQGDVNDLMRIFDEIFQEIREAPSQDLALHWEGKLTEDCFGNKHEALSVLVLGTSIYKEGKLLEERLEKASGITQADASYDLLEV